METEKDQMAILKNYCEIRQHEPPRFGVFQVEDEYVGAVYVFGKLYDGPKEKTKEEAMNSASKKVLSISK